MIQIKKLLKIKLMGVCRSISFIYLNNDSDIIKFFFSANIRFFLQHSVIFITKNPCLSDRISIFVPLTGIKEPITT